jgi:hypothetical protein
MIMRSPIVALLWENWRLSRVEAVVRLGLAVVLALAAIMGQAKGGAAMAFWIVMLLHSMIFFSIAKLNGGRFMDGYKPGFPFFLLYARPVPTVVFVGVAMAYDAIANVALYLACAALLNFAFGQQFPLFSVTLWIVTAHFVYACVQWSTRSRVVQWVGSLAFFLPTFTVLKNRAASSLQIEFSLVENTLMVLICLLSFGLTVAGVVRQRRGDPVASVPRSARSGGYPDSLVNLFRFPCPTSSATRAQVWFELKSSGLPVLAIGLAVAMIIPLLFAISAPFTPVRPAAVFATFFSVPIMMYLLGGNAFGIRRKQGRTYASAFELTQPLGTAQLAGLKVLVRTACLLAALTAVVTSAWISSSLVGAWGSWVVEGGKDVVPGLLQTRGKIGDAIGGLVGYSLAAQMVITSVAVVATVASLAAFAALRARYSRRLLIWGSLLLFLVLALVLLELAKHKGIAPALMVETIFTLTGWILSAAIAIATIYLFWSGFAERALTIRYACVAVLISAAFAAACQTLQHVDAIRLLLPALLILIPGVLAPWSLNRLRHM